MVGGSVESGSSGSLGSFVLALLVAPIVVAVMFIDMGRRSELIFLANLGRSFQGISFLIVAICVLLEVGLRFALG